MTQHLDSDRASFRRHQARTDTGKTITAAYVDQIIEEEAKKAAKSTAAKPLDIAKRYISQQVHAPVLSDFLTVRDLQITCIYLDFNPT